MFKKEILYFIAIIFFLSLKITDRKEPLQHIVNKVFKKKKKKVVVEITRLLILWAQDQTQSCVFEVWPLFKT